MPKAEKGSLKDIGKRIKAKGLQKLKFYCQMCEKQCRDSNGFKCHLTSESHLRQMKLFSESAGKYIYNHSREFEKSFMDCLRLRHSTAKVNANNVYQEVIRDKNHIHMNATRWNSLAGFVRYLGETGKCKIEETERGWYIQYIYRNLDQIKKEEHIKRKQELEIQAEKVAQQKFEQQRKQAIKSMDEMGATVNVQATNMEDEHGTVKLVLSSHPSSKKRKATAVPTASIFGNDDNDRDKEEEEEESDNNNNNKEATIMDVKQSASAMLSISKSAPVKRPKTDITKQAPPERKEEEEETTWLYKNIWVRIVNKDLKDFFRKKAIVEKIDGFTAQISTDSGDILKLDQDDLETVVKAIGDRVRIVKGRHRGSKATVLNLDKKKYQAELELKDGTKATLDFDDFSKLA